jgi:hypothetical protein
MMNKSLRERGEESSGNGFYGFRGMGRLRESPTGSATQAARKKRAAVSGGF